MVSGETFQPGRIAARAIPHAIQVRPGLFMPPEEDGDGSISVHAVLSKLSWALCSHSGAVRPENEDFAGTYVPALPEERGPLFVVADGMGGHAAGEVASRIAVETVLEVWTNGSTAPPKQALRAAARAANAEVFTASLEYGRRGMGTTLTALALSGREAFVAHVGDSRAYLVRDKQCSQLTSDHSRVAEMLRTRLISPEQAKNHPARSMLTRSLGSEPAVQVDLARTDVLPGDTFVLCSDGLWDLVSRRDIAEVTTTPTANEAAEMLVKTALKRGAPDNVTVILVHITSELPTLSVYHAKPRWPFFRRGR